MRRMPGPGTALHQPNVTGASNEGGKSILSTSGKDVEVALGAPQVSFVQPKVVDALLDP